MYFSSKGEKLEKEGVFVFFFHIDRCVRLHEVLSFHSFFLLFLLPFNSLLSYYLNPPSMSSDDLFLMNPLFLFLLFVCFVNVG